MKYYVKVSNGVVIDTPKPISSDPSASPNSSWSLEQMKLNNFLPVDFNYDSKTEYIDTTKPTVLEDRVTYPKNKYSNEIILTGTKKEKLIYLKRVLNATVTQKYDMFDLIYGSLSSDYDSSLRADLGALINYYALAKSEIESLKTKEEVDAYTINFPSI